MMDSTALATDLTRWRLSSQRGVHRWRYLPESEGNEPEQSDAERYLLGILDQDKKKDAISNARSFDDTARDGFGFFTRLQLPEGHWACNYGGPGFLLPGLVFAIYITESEFPKEWKVEMVRYLRHHANEDGGWGLHLEGKSTVFATGLYYVMLRLLGMGRHDSLTSKARQCLLSLGGVAGIPQWGKIWLACLNLYDWDGVNCIPVDLWLLPSWIPFHPSRCKIDFVKHRNTVAPSDAVRSVSPTLLFFFSIVTIFYNYLMPRWLLDLASRRASELMLREERNTDWECLAPVNKAFHMVQSWFEEGPDSERLRLHREEVNVYLWMGRNGMTCNGTNGVQVWDTAFAVQAAVEAGFADDPRFSNTLHKAHDFLEKSQLRINLDDPFRQPRKGGWPFSTKSNGYIVSDCAAESLKAVLLLQKGHGYPQLIDDYRLKDCVDTLLLMQNADGGFASYEKIRGSEWLELLNPAEVFDCIMVEYSYPECTTAVLTSLFLFKRYFPDYRTRDVGETIRKAVGFVGNSQREDGSWYGAWAICFTYATFFALQSLEAVGEQYHNSERALRACEFLLSKQMDDGGWGEHHSSCDERRWIQHEKSQVVNTCWAVLALMHAGYPDPKPIRRGLELIQSRQRGNGEWLHEGVEGVFNRTCMIGYPNYKFYFPVMALGAFKQMYLPKIKV
ncbi:Lanosterol synthase [Colletotrichum fructicola]|uniref:Terpene cyclase/mutase family member n=1 Tax=Colletotrichum fructicola (strain Nara gc5) TaxID=1213859 RepID=A0A7J6JH47_COLFN|nr:Lanosterol synthase [Colletotrichum fructicola]KAE9567932.1 Lanosterol synthase [Colletotrichum fructicola]KAF4489521.1 Lanosterol synthase [Colletotrichum fructicola Nara gc5]